MMIKARDIKKFSKKESQEKLKELRLELIKARISAGKSGKAKIREIKKAIARINSMMRLQK